LYLIKSNNFHYYNINIRCIKNKRGLKSSSVHNIYNIC
jgi:hypothetical protein